MNYLVEDWGGKYQSQDVSTKQGLGIGELLEKVLLEAEMLDLKANPNKRAVGFGYRIFARQGKRLCFNYSGTKRNIKSR